jgi:hypothetical protein
MPKAKLIFDLNDEFEVNAFNRATSATSAFLVIHELQNLLRTAEKYERIDNLELTEGQLIVVDKLREKLYDLLETYKVNMEDLE